MKRSIVLLILLLCTFALPAQPQQLPAGDFRITDSALGFAAHHRHDLQIATNGQNFLAGWIDERAGYEVKRIIVTRLDRGGNALDGEAGTGIALGEPWNISEFSIASDGVDYLVAWQPIEGAVQLVRIDGSTGAVTQLPSIDDSSIYDLSLLWSGDRYLLVHRTLGQDSDVRALELDLSGQHESAVRPLFAATAPILSFEVVPFGGAGDLFAVWTEEGGKTYAKQVNSMPPSNAPVLVAESGTISALGSSGSTVMAVLSTPIEQRMQLTTLVLGANGAVVRGEEAAGEAVSTGQRTDVAWDGSRFRLLAVANDARSVRVATYDANGGVLEYPRTVATGEMYGVVAASAQGDTVAVHTWRTADTGIALQVRAKDIAASATDKLISISKPASGLPTVVWRGDHYLSVWLDRYGDRIDALYMAVNPDGTPRGPATRFASTAGEDDRLAVGTDGENALIVWYERGATADAVKALLVGNAEAGTAGQTLIALNNVSHVQSSIAVHWNGSEYLVVWSSQEPRALYGMRVAADGTKLDAQPVELASGRLAFNRPAIAWDGTRWVVAYTAAVPRDPDAEYQQFDLYIHAVQFTRELTGVGAPMRLSIAEPSAPRIAARNGEVLVVWGTTVESYEIYGARIVHGSNLDGPTGFRIGAGTPTSVHATASSYLVLEQGGDGWTVQGRTASDRQQLFGFVPKLAQTDLVQGGPKPLVVYRAWPTGSDQVPQVRARYRFELPRRRAVR
jgi:hypothetical protein